MEDTQIIELYWQRNEDAIVQTEEKYGALCHKVADNILGNREDVEECLNDALLKVWNSIPPERPLRFCAWLLRIVRNLAVDRLEYILAKKRHADSGADKLLSELDECIPAPTAEGVECKLEEHELTDFLDAWLGELPHADRTLFLCRYWGGESVKELAYDLGEKPQRTAKRLYRLRQKLKMALEQAGYSI